MRTGQNGGKSHRQGIDTLKTQAFPVNGKSVVIGNGLAFRAAPVFLAVVPVFVAARANTGLGLAEGTAEFLPNSPSAIGGLAIFVHSQSSITDQVTCRKSFALGIAFFEGDKSFPIIDRFHGVVDAFRVVALIREHPCKGRIWLAAARMSTATVESMMLAWVVSS